MSTNRKAKLNTNYIERIINEHEKEKQHWINGDLDKRINHFFTNKQAHEIEAINKRILSIMQEPPTRYDGESEESFLDKYYERENKQIHYVSILSLIEKNLSHRV